MKIQNNSKSKHRLFSIIILPIITLFWMIGWILSWVGSQKILSSAISKEELTIKKIKLNEKNEPEKIQPQILA